MKSQLAKKSRRLLRLTRLGSQATRTRSAARRNDRVPRARLALALAGVASASVDVDSDGYYDASVREYDQSLGLGWPNVGAACRYSADATFFTTTMYTTITVRPPRVWALRGYYSQERVAWRPLILNTTTGRWITSDGTYTGATPTTPFTYGTVAPGQPTEFGGGGDVPSANTAFGSNGTANYWAGSRVDKVQ